MKFELQAVALLIFLCAALLLSGCKEEAVQQTLPANIINASTEWTEESICITLCEQYIKDKSNGPCLGIATYNWVCDIAHNPRQEIDNLPENQCADYSEGRAEHFVEVDEECKFIRKA
ncbi:hypothetical protein HZB88_01910 [archaeon]|nr:hypothetical protein [archaeon]